MADLLLNENSSTAKNLHALITGMAQEHAKKAENLKASLAAMPNVQGRHPFDLAPSKAYKSQQRLLKLALRVKELHPQPKGTVKEHLPLPQGFQPEVTS